MRRAAVVAVFAVQALCGFFFVSDILSSLLGLRRTPLSRELRELLEIGAALGLVLGLILGGLVSRRSLRDRARAEARLQLVSGALMDLLAERFDEWGLTRAERDVALFLDQGNQHDRDCRLRGTVRAQSRRKPVQFIARPG